MNKIDFHEKYNSQQHLFTVYTNLSRYKIETLYEMWYARSGSGRFDMTFGEYVKQKHPEAFIYEESELDYHSVYVG